MSKGFTATRSRSVQQARKELTRYLKTLSTVPREELERSAEVILQQAHEQVPYDTGKLHNAIYCRVSRNKARPGIVAGASARSPRGYNYAGIQHENTEFNHLHGGKDHFISDPFEAETQALMLRMSTRLEKIE